MIFHSYVNVYQRVYYMGASFQKGMGSMCNPWLWIILDPPPVGDLFDRLTVAVPVVWMELEEKF